MIQSMTGYGRAHREGESGGVTVEMKSVNNRFLKVSVRLPESWEPLGSAIENVVKEKASRGTVYVNVRKQGAFAGAKELIIHRAAIEECRRQLAEIEGGDEVTLGELLSLPGMVGVADEGAGGMDEVWKEVEAVVREALDEMIRMRRREGEHLKGVLLRETQGLREMVNGIRERAPEMVKSYRDRLTARVKELLEGSAASLSAPDLAREVAIFAERSDIREEIDRMDSHLAQLAALLEKDEPVGRPLEFLIQEMFREANTMGSKAADVELGTLVLDAKAAVDRLKEQVMNVE
jgi:uncharacterized protein (TIGR00255 family)